MQSTTASDLHVQSLADALKDVKVDLIVCGSIGAVESVRFIRSLRRLGAHVVPWLTAGGEQFITPLSLEWAADHVIRSQFSGTESHIATGDVCMIAPASANFLQKISQGTTDTPAAALVASYLGAKKPVFILPNMHESLWNSPGVKENLERVKRWGVILAAREEEGKQKFPEPKTLADIAAHEFNRLKIKGSALITMGGTKGYIDDVRYVSNYSSGALGSKIAEELFRNGVSTYAVAGACEVLPQAFSQLIRIDTNEQLEKESLALIKAHNVDAVIGAASVLDYVPQERISGKVRSGSPNLDVRFKPTVKIIKHLQPAKNIKVGFKLETEFDADTMDQLIRDQFEQNELSLMVLNQLSDVGINKHRAIIAEQGRDKGREASFFVKTELASKELIARFVCAHVLQRLGPSKN
jgi:phosphopantothenoylcysteine decarboxylase/phosphopantothenate--cysteine ligase